MERLMSGIILDENEKMQIELEAELWATSSNPIARLIGTIRKFFNFIFGIKKKSFLVITDKRVIEVVQDKVCWCFNVGKDVKYVLPNSVKEVGYTKRGTFMGCCCQAYTLYYEAGTQFTEILLRGVDESETFKITNAFYKVIKSAQ